MWDVGWKKKYFNNYEYTPDGRYTILAPNKLWMNHVHIP